MTPETPLGKIEVVRTMEKDLIVARKVASKALRTARRSAGISFRMLSSKVRRTPAALHLLETGKTWNTRTAERVARAIEAMTSNGANAA